jgi:hypothetical protein
MRLKRGLGLLVGLLVLFLVVKETREPYLWLFVDDWIHAKPPPQTLPLGEDLALRLYADPRPHVGKIARLQKGAVLVVDDQELIEEGFGFGLPLIEVAGQAYLSRSAIVERVDSTLVKHYEMDTLDTPSGFLRRKYEPVASIGTVVVSYTVGAQSVVVEVDLSGLETTWNRAYLMNEQGAGAFTRYEEAGLVAEGEQLGKWQLTEARTGCIVAEDGSVRFCVETEQESPRYYGRERYRQYYWVGVYALSWAGIDLELEPPLTRFQYDIAVETPDRD